MVRKPEEIHFNWPTAVALGRAFADLAAAAPRGRALAFGFLLLALMLTINGLNVVNSYVGRDFMTAIEGRDGPAFAWGALRYLSVLLLLTLAAVFYRYIEERLGLLWRDAITRRVVDRYLHDRLFYRLGVAGVLTNPDQRIADDVRTFTTMSMSLALIFSNGVVTVVAFSGVIWSISQPLFAVAVGYALMGSLLAIYVGRPLVKLNYDQADREADFRADLIHIREHIDSVALLNGEAYFHGRLLGRVDALVGNLRRLIDVNRNLGFFTTGYNYMIQLIPVFIVAPLFIYGSAEFGVISQSSMAFAHVVGAFSMVVTQFPILSSYAAVLARLSPLTGAPDERALPADGRVVVEEADRVSFDNLTLRSPMDGQVLLRGLTLDADSCRRLILTATSDHVTNALQRAVAGIWETGEGRILRPPLRDVHFLPDRSYLPPGRLRDLLQGSEDAPISDEEIWQALRTVGADHVVDRIGGLDVERDWDDLFSVEEQMLLSLARLLVATPRVAILSHVGPGLGADAAARVLDALAARDVACIWLGGGIVQRSHFEVIVAIDADGTWTRSSADKYRA